MLRIIIAITLLLNSVAIFGDELSDRLREQELLQQQLESAQQRVRQNETRQRQTGTEIQRTASLKRVTDNRLRDLRAQEAVVADSLRSVEQRLELTRDRLQSLKSSLNDQMNMLLRVDRSYRPQGVQHRDQKFISMLSVQTKQEIDVARGYQIVLMQEQETHANEKSKVNASLRQTNNESRNYSRRITNLEAQRGQLTRELQSLINRLMAARGEETVDRFGAGQMAWPVRGRIIRSFGQETREYNTSVVSNGIDIAVAENTTVHAAEAGTVIFADRYGGQGKMVIIDHKNGFFSLYGYCNDLLVTVGTQVRRAQAIAKSGRTGSASEPSLHFEVRRDGRAVNPLTYLQ